MVLLVAVFMLLTGVFAEAGHAAADVAGRPSTLAEWKARNATLPDYTALQQKLANVGTPITWLFTGDSITHGVQHTHTLKRYSEYFEDNLRTNPVAGYDRSKDVVLNTGVSSATTAWLRSNISGWVLQRHADVVFMTLAMNDSNGTPAAVQLNNFVNNLLQTIKEVRQQGGIPVLMTQNYTVSTAHNNALDNYFNAVRNLAAQNSVMLVDYAQWWLDNNGGQKANPSLLGDNSLHPNELAHLKWAQLILDALNLKDSSSRLSQATTAQAPRTGSAVTFPSPSALTTSDPLRRLQALYRNTTSTMWSFLGGATTQGTLSDLSTKNFVQLFEDVLRWEAGSNPPALRMKFVEDAGLNGLSSGGLLDRYEAQVKPQGPVALFVMPDVVFKGQLVEGDVNQFKSNIAAIVDQAQAAGTQVVLVTPPQLDSRVSEYADALKTVGVEKNTVVVDATSWINQTNALNPAGTLQGEWFDVNGFMTAKGHLALAKFVMTQIGLAPIPTANAWQVWKLNYDGAAGSLPAGRVGVAPEFSAAGSFVPVVAGPVSVVSESGDTRADTSVVLADRLDEIRGSSVSDEVFVVGGGSFADPLALTPLSAALGSDVLMTGSADTLDSVIIDKVKALAASGVRYVTIVGGDLSVSPAVEEQLKELAPDVRVSRIAGDTRFETAYYLAAYADAAQADATVYDRLRDARVNDDAGLASGLDEVVRTSGSGDVFLADGTQFADALVAGPAASKTDGVVLLSDGDTLDGWTKKYVDASKASVVTVGGPATTAAQADNTVHVVKSNAGATRYETAGLVNEYVFGSSTTTGVVIASGEQFADAALAGNFAAQLKSVPALTGGAVMLTARDQVPQATRDYLANTSTPTIYTVGGPLAIDPATITQLTTK